MTTSTKSTTLMSPYVSFDGNATEAFEFYERVFGGTVDTHTYASAGMTGMGEKLMHGQIDADAGFTIMGADMMGDDYQPMRGVSISLAGADEAKMRGWWEQLAEGGTIEMPLEPQEWAPLFGMVTDRFGVRWMINVDEV